MKSLNYLKQISIIASIFLMFVQCSAKVEKEVENNPMEVLVDMPVATMNEITPHGLQLKDSQKWTVDAGMNSGVVNIQKAVEKFKGKNLVDYQLLGDKIGDQTSKIISSCTMKGQGHDELHKWLLPFLGLKDALMMATSVDEGVALLLKIEAEIKVYQTYFK